MQLQLAAAVAGLVSLVPGKLQRTSAAGELRQSLLHLLRRLCQGVGGQGPAVLQRAASDGGSQGAAQVELVTPHQLFSGLLGRCTGFKVQR